jgi:hypothetical protein
VIFVIETLCVFYIVGPELLNIIHIGTCRVVHVTIMTGSSSDDWILLVLRLQVLLITLNYTAIPIVHTLQSFHTDLLCPNLYSVHWSELHYTALINATNRLLVSLYYNTHKVFKTHAKSSQVDLSTLTACLLLLTPPAYDWLTIHLGFPYRLGTDHAENTVSVVASA